MFVRPYLATTPSSCSNAESETGSISAVWVTSSSSNVNVSGGTRPPPICTIQKVWAHESNSDVREPENEDSLLARTKGHFPESDNPEDTELRYPFYQCHMKNTCGTYAPWLTGRAKGLAAGFGVFLSVCVMILLPPHTHTPFTQNPICHLWAINHVRGGETFGPFHLESHLVLPDLGAALFCWFFLSSAVLSLSGFFSKHLKRKKRKRSVSLQCTLMNNNESDLVFTCCLKEKSNEPKCMLIFPHY